VVSLFGTSVALALFALATNFWLLLVSRIVDGITGGNISIAQAMLADMTEGKDRAKAFGLLGASFGFGFLVGPALGGLLSQFSITAPFWFASAIALIATFCSMFFLKETHHTRQEASKHQPLFNFKLLWHALVSPVTGLILFISLASAIAQNAWIIGFQSFSVDTLQLTARDTGLIFAGAGLVSIVMQSGGVRLLLKLLRSQQRVLTFSLLGATIVSAWLFFAVTPLLFTIGIFIYMIVFSPQMPMVGALLSEKTDKSDQGAILGINQSYISLGQVIGPLMAGVIATISTPAVFLFVAGTVAVAWVMSLRLNAQAHKVNF
jgi:predicted MFS family arabinose efflux permease